MRHMFNPVVRASALLALVIGGACGGSSTAPVALPYQLAISAGGGQAGVVGKSLGTPLTVTVQDVAGNPVTGTIVTWNATGGSTVSAPTVTSNAVGQAAVTWTLGTRTGADSVTATIIGSAGTVSVVFSATASAGAPSSIVVVSGDGQSAPAGSALPLAIVVKVLDGYGNPVPNATVTWAAAAGSLASLSTITDANGLTSDALVLGNATGSDLISVFTAGASQTVSTTVSETAN